MNRYHKKPMAKKLKKPEDKWRPEASKQPPFQGLDGTFLVYN